MIALAEQLGKACPACALVEWHLQVRFGSDYIPSLANNNHQPVTIHDHATMFQPHITRGLHSRRRFRMSHGLHSEGEPDEQW